MICLRWESFETVPPIVFGNVTAVNGTYSNDGRSRTDPLTHRASETKTVTMVVHLGRKKA